MVDLVVKQAIINHMWLIASNKRSGYKSPTIGPSSTRRSCHRIRRSRRVKSSRRKSEDGPIKDSSGTRVDGKTPSQSLSLQTDVSILS